MWDNIRKILYKACDVLELLMAGAVAVGIVIAAMTLWPDGCGSFFALSGCGF
mgnify:CR=1 FL=1